MVEKNRIIPGLFWCSYLWKATVEPSTKTLYLRWKTQEPNLWSGCKNNCLPVSREITAAILHEFSEQEKNYYPCFKACLELDCDISRVIYVLFIVLTFRPWKVVVVKECRESCRIFQLFLIKISNGNHNLLFTNGKFWSDVSILMYDVRIAGYEKPQATVMVYCTAEGGGEQSNVFVHATAE